MTSFPSVTRVVTAARPTLRLIRWLQRAIAVHNERRALRRLSADQRRDVGVTYRQALKEARRAFWDLPGGRWRP